jgi:hypothetical protein
MNPISNKIANLIAQNKSDDEIYELLKNEGYKDYEISNAVIAHKRSGNSGFS